MTISEMLDEIDNSDHTFSGYEIDFIEQMITAKKVDPALFELNLTNKQREFIENLYARINS